MLRRYLAVLAASAVAGASSLAMTGSASAAAPVPSLTRLSADVVPGLSALAPAGATSPSTAVEVDVALSGADPSGEAAYLKALYAPGSAEYHHFLTTAQVASEFGAPAAAFQSALAYSTGHGLSVVRTSSTRELIVLSGTVAQAEATFGVTIDNYVWHGLHFYANENAPAVPAGLGIVGVVGLNTAQVMHTFASTNKTAGSGVKPQQNLCEGSLCVGASTPEDMWASYDQPSSDTGQGQKVAVFGEGDWTPPLQDLRDFEANPDQLTTCGSAGLPTCPDALPAVPVRVVEVDGKTAKYTDTAGDEEWDIDTQSSTGMAPNLAELDLYFGTSLTDADVLNVVDSWESDPNAPLQASASYGECEYDPAAQQLPSGSDFAMGQAAGVSYNQATEAANLEGRTLFSSSGDTGSSCPIVPVDTNGVTSQAFPAANFPCSSPGVVCVGGTVLYTTGATPNQRAAEYSWNDTGGGTSLVYPEPTWQTGATGTPGPGAFSCLYTDQGAPVTAPTPCRSVPDIAAQSGDIATNGYGIYFDGSATQQGGTSLASPMSMGLWARIQAAASGGDAKGLGFADPVFYKNQASFYDIGNPADTPPSPPTSNSYFTSAPGWDYTSGLGVIDVTHLMQAVDNTLTPTSNQASPDSPTISYFDSNYSLIPAAAPADPACVPLFTGHSGESSYPPGAGSDYPNLDVVQGDMHSDGKNLTTILTIENMSEWSPASPPGGTANEYYMLWTYKGTTYYTNAQVAASGDTFSWGTKTTTGGTGSYNAGTGAVTGAIVDGANGTVTTTIPLSDIGSPASGDTLTSPNSSVSVLAGTPATGGFVFTASTVGPQYNYTLGEICAATGIAGSSGGAGPGGGNVPEAPVAAAIPVLGLGVAGGLILMRRRRRLSSTSGAGR